MVVEGAPARASAWSWLPPALWTCLRCLAMILTRDAQPRCPRCGLHSDD